MLLLFPDTPAGAALRRLLVEAPARALNRLRQTHWLLILALALVALAAAALGRELFFVVAQGTPELVAWVAAFDVATYVDVFAAALIVAAAVRLRSAAGVVRAALGALWRLWRPGRVRRARRSSPRRTPPPRADEDPWPAAPAAA